MWNFPFFPEQASTIAGRVDLLFWTLVVLSAVFAIPIAAVLVYFAVKYRAGAQVNRAGAMEHNTALELTWIVVPLALGLGIFAWSGSLFLDISRPPVRSTQIYVVGKQWMWKVQHPTGQREINELHVPVGQPIKLLMTSQDVIHSFFIPAFRVKQDVIPGRYTELWFEATQTGEYHLFCTEYCGTDHSVMTGRIVVMEPTEYQAWLSGGSAGASAQPQTMAQSGEALFQQLGCSGCHNPDGGGTGPSLVGIFGQAQELEGGGSAVADENYIRESILRPQAQVTAGYQPVMPSYEGQIDEEQIQQLVAYIQQLGTSAESGNEQ